MSLSRQLISVVFLLFLMVFAGTFIVTANNLREYLITQLESHAQDTATSLGLSITKAYGNNDTALVNSMVDAIYDRGYYRQIVIRKLNGDIVLQRKQEVKIGGVPKWFVKILPLKAPSAETQITVGWKNVATLTVQSHPGFAYAELWRSVVETFWWSVGAFLFALFVVMLVIRWVLMPLSQMEKQALAIADREFPVLDKLPFTRELRRAVIAMNKMSIKVKAIFEEQSALAEKLRHEAYVDPVSGLTNRKAFKMRVQHVIRDERYLFGAMFMMQIKGLTEYNDRNGYVAGDELITNTTDVLQNLCKNYPNSIPSRIGGADFCVFIPGITIRSAEEFATELGSRMAGIPGNRDKMLVGHIGVAYYHGTSEFSVLLSEVDMALRTAQKKGDYAWHMYDKDTTTGLEIHTANEWKAIIEKCLKEERFYLLYQPIYSCNSNAIMHYEVLLRVHSIEGVDIPAGVFLPMAERFAHLGYTTRIDQYVVEGIIDKLEKEANTETKYAINLSPSSLEDIDFIEWLEGSVQNIPNVAKRLIFETTEYGVLSNLDGLKRLSEKLRKVGVSFSIDHFGSGHVPFGYLHGLKLDYIKIDGSYIQNLTTDKENRFYVQSIAQIAHSLDIQVIAEFIETEEVWEEVKVLYLDGGQGYFLGKPQIK